MNSSRNSECAAPLASLDWTRWFTDGQAGQLYLHVHGQAGAIMRVYCRRTCSPRLEFRGGELWWLVDRPRQVGQSEAAL